MAIFADTPPMRPDAHCRRMQTSSSEPLLPPAQLVRPQSRHRSANTATGVNIVLGSVDLQLMRMALEPKLVTQRPCSPPGPSHSRPLLNADVLMKHVAGFQSRGSFGSSRPPSQSQSSLLASLVASGSPDGRPASRSPDGRRSAGGVGSPPPLASPYAGHRPDAVVLPTDLDGRYVIYPSTKPSTRAEAQLLARVLEERLASAGGDLRQGMIESLSAGALGELADAMVLSCADEEKLDLAEIFVQALLLDY